MCWNMLKLSKYIKIASKRSAIVAVSFHMFPLAFSTCWCGPCKDPLHQSIQATAKAGSCDVGDVLMAHHSTSSCSCPNGSTCSTLPSPKWHQMTISNHLKPSLVWQFQLYNETLYRLSHLFIHVLGSHWNQLASICAIICLRCWKTIIRQVFTFLTHTHTHIYI